MQDRMLSTAELSKKAEIFVDSNIPIKYYFRSAEELFKQAKIYENEGDLQTSYVQFLKYSNLGLLNLEKHTDYKNPAYKVQKSKLVKNCVEALNTLEKIKPIIDKQYEDWKNDKLRLEIESTQKEKEKQIRQTQISTQHVNTYEEKTDADESGKRTWNLQDELRGVIGVGSRKHLETESDTFRNKSPPIAYENLKHRNESDGYTYKSSHLNMALPSLSISSLPPPLPPKSGSLHLHSPIGFSPQALPSYSFSSLSSAQPPKLPPKPNFYREDYRVPDGELPPALPPKIYKEDVSAEIVPDIDEKVEAMTEDGAPLRSLYAPLSLLDRFLDIAHANTLKKLETCGILSGCLKNNAFTITTLLIPKQTSTSDTCVTTNEEELFEYQNQHDLLTLGWIHTHPTQTCFMSSVDLHTHCSYQLMMPEAIAIVLAPTKDPNYGVFRLTDPPGITTIASCRREGMFHPHPDLPLYTDAMDMGHVKMANLDLVIVDLRKS